MSHKKKSAKQVAKKTPWLGIALVALFIVGVVIAGVVILTGDDAEESTAFAEEISVQEAEELRSDGVLIVDVREQEEWDQYHVPNAVLIPLGELPNRLDELPKDQEIIVMCNSGNRSRTGRDILQDAGFSNVTSMAGGIQAWMQAGYETCYDGSC